MEQALEQSCVLLCTDPCKNQTPLATILAVMWKDTPSPAEARRASGLAIDWQAALETHHRWLRTVVYARLREPEAVEEVMQEVALAAVRQASPLADPAKVAPWLYRLAVRQALLFRRKCGRRRRLTTQYAERLPAAQRDGSPPNPLDWLLLAERRQVVRDALRRLAARDAEILLLKYSEGWSYHQIAAHLGVSHSAVETRLHRARNRLRDELLATRYVEVG
jgi:RNA polymerase sigma factor (sigma-70 family)